MLPDSAPASAPRDVPIPSDWPPGTEFFNDEDFGIAVIPGRGAFAAISPSAMVPESVWPPRGYWRFLSVSSIDESEFRALAARTGEEKARSAA